MARQEANEAFQQSSFLYGGNAAYIEELYASWQENPASVNGEWNEFFAALKDDSDAVKKNVHLCHQRFEERPGIRFD